MITISKLINRIIKKRIESNISVQKEFLNDGNLHIFLLGSGGPVINEDRVSSSIAIIVENEFFLIDIGPGTYRNAELLGLPVSHLTKIFLTHFHSDHIGDLGEANVMSWANGRDKPIHIYGPEGVDKVVEGFTLAYQFDKEYRIAHHGEETLPKEAANPVIKPISIEKRDDLILVFEKEHLKIYAFPVDHPPIFPALGYRIVYKDKIVVITGDTNKTEELINFCQDADIIFADAISYDLLNRIINVSTHMGQTRISKILTDVQSYHMNPKDAALLAKEANTKKLVIVHITPQVPNKIAERIYLKGLEDIYNNEIVLGNDLMKFELETR